MPELPEVETTVRGLAPALEGRRIRRVLMRCPDLRRPMPQDLVQRRVDSGRSTFFCAKCQKG